MKVNWSVPFFYDDDANPWGGGGATVNNNPDTPAPAAEAPAETTPPAETTAAPAATPPAETTTPPADNTTPPAAAPAATTPAPAAPEPVKDWRETATHEEIVAEAKKKLDKEGFLRLAGIDEETIKAIQFKDANGGKWDDYLKIKNTDYKALAPEQLIEMSLKEKYGNRSAREFEIILKSELSKYKLNREDFNEDSEEAILGKIRLEEDAEELRKKYIDKQDGLKAPEPQPDTTAQARELAQQQLTASIRNSEAVKNLQTSKLISYGTGEEAFNYEIKDTDGLVNAAILAAVQNGNVPTEAEISSVMKTLAYHMNPAAVEKALVDHGKILGERNVRKEAANTAPNEQTTTLPDATTDDAAALRNGGTVVNRG